MICFAAMDYISNCPHMEFPTLNGSCEDGSYIQNRMYKKLTRSQIHIDICCKVLTALVNDLSGKFVCHIPLCPCYRIMFDSC